jgi:hypothetical protein
LLNPDGDLVWAHALGGPESNDRAAAVALDGAGNFYVGGAFGRWDGGVGAVAATFDPAENVTDSSEGGQDAFLASYRPDGSYRWSLSFGNLKMNTDERITDIAVADDGSCFVTGSFHGIVNFRPRGGDPLIRTLPDQKSGTFVARYSADGVCQWAIEINSHGTDSGDDSWSTCALDGKGSLYVAGSFQGDIVSFNPLGAPTTLTSHGGSDMFLAKYDVRNGVLTWVLQLGGNESEHIGANGLECDRNGNPTFTGRLSGTGAVDLDPTGGERLVVSSSLFLARISQNGEPIFIVGMQSGRGDAGTGIAFDSKNNTYLGGYFDGPATFDPDGGMQKSPTSPTTDAFIARYDTEGNLDWVNALGTGDATETNTVRGIAVDSEDNILAVGALSGSTVDLDPGPGSLPVLLNGMTDAFLVKYNADGTLWHEIESNVAERGSPASPGFIRYSASDECLSLRMHDNRRLAARVIVCDCLGRYVAQTVAVSGAAHIDCTGWPGGTYFARVVTSGSGMSRGQSPRFGTYRFTIRH